MGLRARKNHNDGLRARGIEPEPGFYAGIKRHIRYLKRTPARAIKIKNPERYLSSHARGMLALRKVLEARSSLAKAE
jgi:hypothetical protein